VDSPLEASKANGITFKTNPGRIGMVARDVNPSLSASLANKAKRTLLSNGVYVCISTAGGLIALMVSLNLLLLNPSGPASMSEKDTNSKECGIGKVKGSFSSSMAEVLWTKVGVEEEFGGK
jgi:hypothetical protein